VNEVCYIDWHVTPFRAERWFEIWEPAAARALSFGAKSWSLTRSEDDPLLFRQSSIWDERGDFERYWFSEEISKTREAAIGYYGKPLLPSWHTLVASD
jgi:hypothetical protein